MDSFSAVDPFQERRRRLFLTLLSAVGLPVVIGVVSYQTFGIPGALSLGAVSLLIALWLSARWATRAYRCPACQRIPLKVQVRAWTKYTRYLRWLQVSKRFTVYPPWAVLFLDFSPKRCPGCGTALGKTGGEYVGAT